MVEDSKKDSPSPGFTEILGRALVDEEFRDLLFANREETIADFQLSPKDLKALDNLEKETLEEIARDFGNQTTVKVYVKVTKSF